MDIRYFDEVARLTGVLGLKVTRKGEELVHATWDEEVRRNVYSASKSFVACAVGLAQSEGLLSIDEPLTEAFADSLPTDVSENLKKAKVRDLLTMCLGQEKAELMGPYRPLYEEDDWVKLALSIPFVHEPGSTFVYSNAGPYLAGMLVQRRAGCDLVEYLTPRLFAPLNIKRPTWEVDPLGNTFGSSGLMLTLSELHRFGLLMLQQGEWEGKQLIDEGWIKECTRPQSAAPYGYFFWMGEKNSFRADGKNGQLSIVFPEKEAVITVVSESRHVPLIFRAIYDTLWPQL